MTETPDVPTMSGFPPAPEHRWTRDEWQFGPVNRWAFQHVREIVSTARVSRNPDGPRKLRQSETALDLTIPVPRVDGRETPLAEVLDDTFTDGFIVLSDGNVVVEQYRTGMHPDTPHLLMSVSKSLVGTICGILTDRGVIDLDVPLTAYIPELAASGYDGATTRHLLDMRSGIAFSEDYLDEKSEVRQLDQVLGWAPETIEGLPDSIYDWLVTLEPQRDHGGVFEYRSCETDVLGWVCERASGIRMPELMSELMWSPLRTEHDMDAAVDPAGAVLHDGGFNATLRDLARFGQLIADDGLVESERVVPSWWIRDTVQGQWDSRQAFADSPTDSRLPGGMYRNQFWIPYADSDVLMALGIHGQLVYIDRANNVVGAKLSSWPYPQDATMFLDTLAMMRAIVATV